MMFGGLLFCNCINRLAQHHTVYSSKVPSKFIYKNKEKTASYAAVRTLINTATLFSATSLYKLISLCCMQQ